MTEPETKLWFVELKPGVDVKSPSFQEAWRDLLAFCNEASGPKNAGHSLWLDSSGATPQRLVYITGYPNRASNEAADARYIKELMPKIQEFVEHKLLLLLALDYPFVIGERNWSGQAVSSIKENGRTILLEVVQGATEDIGSEEMRDFAENVMRAGALHGWVAEDWWEYEMRLKKGQKMGDRKELHVFCSVWGSKEGMQKGEYAVRSVVDIDVLERAELTLLMN